MRAVIIVLAFVCTATGCSDRNSVASLRAHGVVSIYHGAPFCRIYVGLRPDEQSAFEKAFWHFAEQHHIRKPRMSYGHYSGPPIAAALNEHIAIYEDLWPTSVIVARQKSLGTAATQEGDLHSWQLGIWEDAYWPTNACHINKDGQNILAAYSGCIGMAPFDTSYPAKDFRQLAEALTAAIRSAFPDRTVTVVSYYSDTQ